MPLPRTLPPIAWVKTRATVPQGFFVGIYCHDKYIKYGTCLQRDIIRSRSGDLNPGLPGTKQPLYHLSHQLLIFLSLVATIFLTVTPLFGFSQGQTNNYIGGLHSLGRTRGQIFFSQGSTSLQTHNFLYLIRKELFSGNFWSPSN